MNKPMSFSSDMWGTSEASPGHFWCRWFVSGALYLDTITEDRFWFAESTAAIAAKIGG